MNKAPISQILSSQTRRFLGYVTPIKFLFPITLVMLLVACSTDFFDTTPTRTVRYDSQKKAAYYLNLMEQNNDLSKTDLQLFAIRALLQEKRINDAQSYLNKLPATLTPDQEVEKRLVLADLAIRQGTSSDFSDIEEASLNNVQKNYFYHIKLRKDKNSQDVNSAARDYIALEKMATSSERPALINQTWRYFKTLSDEDREKLIVFSHEIALKGWYDLIYMYRQALKVDTMPVFDEENNTLEVVTPTLSKAEQKERIEKVVTEWQKQYPAHPAAVLLPKELQRHQIEPELLNQKGKKVALFLPLEGSSKVFGDVVKAGYSDASKFYPEEPVQTIMVFDTTSDSMANLVSEAQRKGAELIVGPLLKEDVASLIKQGSSLPVLALNKVNLDTKRNNRMMCYFGLSPEDEISSAVRHIYKEGKRRPLVITSDNAMGKRVAAAFGQEWQRLYDSPVYVQYFESAQRLKEDMNRGVGLRAEGQLISAHAATFEPWSKRASSRQITELTASAAYPPYSSDIDAIYISSTQDELEFIKPMIDMHTQVNTRGRGKGPIPLYTSSRSQNASGSPDYRYEMENVQFSDIPLLVAKNPVLPVLPVAIKRDYSLARLYAMGVDAWRLANRFGKLAKTKEPIIDGLTGVITVTGSCDIDRDLPWRIYKQGQVRAVE